MMAARERGRGGAIMAEAWHRRIARAFALAAMLLSSGGAAVAHGGSPDVVIYSPPAPAPGKRYPMLLVLHGVSGLDEVYGEEIKQFAKELAAEGYVTAVPELHPVMAPLPADIVLPKLEAAIAKVAGNPAADGERVGFVGYSLGAYTAMTYLTKKKPPYLKVLVDFFGPVDADIEQGSRQLPSHPHPAQHGG
jgi:dienelactone hydrolase